MRHLITSALPYANGPLHFGHLVGAYLPADVYTRHVRQKGEKAVHICGTDEHGVAIMLGAQKEKEDYKAYVDRWHNFFKELFHQYQVDFDFFGQTSADYHKEEVEAWFKLLNDRELISKKDDQQLYCNDCSNHLPDRFVEGKCYKCGYEAARGDECPSCGLWVEPSKLIEPVCKICSSQNIKEVTSTQYYLLLSKFHSEFRNWLETKEGKWRKTVFPFVDSLSKTELHDRAISRDLDWGIDVPLPDADGKKLYVWFDAPIGYVSNLKEYLKSIDSKEDYLKDWWKNDDTQIVNFIGKDNIIFHTIIFPVMSLASGRVNPVTNVPANQFLNLAGKPFSKSSGWYIDAQKAISDFGADALRYYLISIMPENQDSSFTWDHFAARVNNELANNIGNLINRCLKFWDKNWKDGIEGQLFSGFADSSEGLKLQQGLTEHLELLDSIQIRKALEKVMAIGNNANTFFSDREPWAQIKEDRNKAATTIAYTTQYILALGVLLTPYLPSLSKRILSYFDDLLTPELKSNIYKGNLDVIESIFTSRELVKLSGEPQVLVPKIDEDLIKKLSSELQ
ncbi:MAG: methionine--tRNA ligase [Bacteriovoracaceae bacterium]|nr:methionine--tRNA ligase [Bacteriovoracaceae bacterium]